MQIYLAPLEGITGFVYRNAFSKYVGGLDKYFMPFLNPKSYGCFSAREKEELARENNQGLNVIPQILTNDVEDFHETVKRLQEFGYEEVNLNLGCPSKPVVNKGRGAGAIDRLEQLDEFLEKIFEKCDIDISIKTRIGMNLPDEFIPLLEIYNKYPLQELIVHPRLGKDFYNNKPNWKVFGEALAGSVAPVCYNGDISTLEDYKALITAFPELDRVMLGRGLIRNPFLFEGSWDDNKFWEFHDEVLANYQRVIPSDMELTVLFKMKELWAYMKVNFADGKEWQRKINETKDIVEYKSVIKDMFDIKK